jgi:hypothetical protein
VGDAVGGVANTVGQTISNTVGQTLPAATHIGANKRARPFSIIISVLSSEDRYDRKAFFVRRR